MQMLLTKLSMCLKTQPVFVKWIGTDIVFWCTIGYNNVNGIPVATSEGSNKPAHLWNLVVPTTVFCIEIDTVKDASHCEDHINQG